LCHHRLIEKRKSIITIDKEEYKSLRGADVNHLTTNKDYCFASDVKHISCDLITWSIRNIGSKAN
jgi:hypothetical protein